MIPMKHISQLFVLIVAVNIFTSSVAQVERLLIIHGGAGSITPEHGAAKKVVMIEAVRAGYRALLANDDPLDAVEQTIRILEDSPAFNAGTGAVQTITKEIELDAIIINGTDLTAGAVGAVRHIKNPISLARIVKDNTDHALMVGQAAELLALNNGVVLVPTSSLIANYSSYDYDYESLMDNHIYSRKKRSTYFDVGTVGCIAMNSKGQIGVGTSTGGMSNKLEGRVGDTPVIGGGTLADDEIGGVSATGWGEAFMRYRVASRIANLLENGENATDAIATVLAGMASRIPGADGGAIVITKDGEIGFAWNSEQMGWAYTRGSDIHYGVDKGEDLTAPLNPPSEGSSTSITSSTISTTTNTALATSTESTQSQAPTAMLHSAFYLFAMLVVSCFEFHLLTVKCYYTSRFFENLN